VALNWKKKLRAAGKGVDVAKTLRISTEHLSRILNGHRNAGPVVASRIARLIDVELAEVCPSMGEQHED